MSLKTPIDGRPILVRPPRVVRPGDQLGPYLVDALIGKGGMGEVFRARDPRLGRNVAIKVLPERGGADALRRFEIEARAAGAINHPNILVLYDIGDDAGVPYVVTELLEGQSLRVELEAGPLPARRAVAYAQQIVAGLVAAHDKGIVHRDLKPDNIYLTSAGVVKILDFGLAKLLDEPAGGSGGAGVTRTGAVLGTAAYMAPEQIRGEPVDPRADLFAVGMILYEMLAGRRPFVGASTADIMSAILNGEPAPLPPVAPALERLILHLLEKRPGDRFQSARDLGFGLESLAAASATASRRRMRVRRQWPLAALALVAAGLVGAGAHALLSRPHRSVPAFTRLTFRTEKFWRARFTTDGHSVIFGAHAPGDPGRIATFAVEIGVSEARKVAIPEDIWLSAVSDHELIVSEPGPVSRMAMGRVPLTGGAPRMFRLGIIEADVSPDGETLALEHIDGGHYVLELPAGHPIFDSPRELMFVRMSPDLQKVAVIQRLRHNDQRGDVLVIGRDGSVQRLGEGLVNVQGLAWSRRGEVWVAASAVGDPRQLWALGLDGSRRLLAVAPTAMMLFDVDASGRALVAGMQRTRTLLVRRAGEVSPHNLSWLDASSPTALSRDGKTVLFVEDGDAGGPGARTYLRSLDGGDAVLLGPGVGTSLSPDGQWVLVMPPDRSGPIHIVPVGPGAAEELPQVTPGERGDPCWFPDGKHILYVGQGAAGQAQLFVQERGGKTARPVGPPGYRPDEQPISIDGKLLLASDAQKHVIIPVDGGEPRAIPGLTVAENAFAFADDGQVFVRSDPKAEVLHIFKIDPATGARTPVLDVDNPPVIDAVRITPDGKTFAYRHNSRSGDLYLVDVP